MATLFDLHGIDLGLEAPKAPERSGLIRRAVGDTGVSLLKGAIGVPEAAVGLADLVTGGRAGLLAEQAGFRPREAREFLDELYSPEQQAANREVQEAEGFTGTVAAALRNPSTIFHAAAESAPSLLPAAAVARGAMAVAPRLPGIAAAGLGEGAVAAGLGAEQVRQQTEDGLLTADQAGVIAASGSVTGVIGAVAGKIANRLGIGDVNQLMAGVQQAGPAAQKSFARAMVEGFATEGVLQELPQSAQEQIAQNVALGKPWDEGVGAAAGMGMLAGGVIGGIAGPIGRNRGQEPELVAEPPGSEALAADAEQRLASATTVSEMAAAANDLVNSVPLTPATPAVAPVAPFGITAEQEARAMSAMEAQAASDQQAIKFGSRGVTAPIAAPPADQLPAGAQQGDAAASPEASAAFVEDAPFLDRLATVTEQIRSPEIRQRLRDTVGEDALNTVLYYVQQANREGGQDGIPQATRERMLELAEVVVGRATLQPVAGRATVASAVPAMPAVGAAAAPAQIELDTRPTGTIRADAAGNAAPETRADAINTAQVQAQGAAQRDAAQAEAQTLGTQARKASAVWAEPNPRRPAPEIKREPRRRSDGRLIDPVAAYVETARRTNTPAARAFVQEFEAGRITRADVVKVMQTQPADPLAGLPAAAPVADPVAERLQRAAAEAPKPAQGLQIESGYRARAGDTAIDAAARQAATSPTNNLPEPTPAQKEAGNYKVGRLRLAGLDISIENPEGSVRRGVDPDGKAWENTLRHHYGYLRGTQGRDGDHVDVFVKPGTPDDFAGTVFVVDQVDPKTGRFDEHKVLMGFASEAEAREAYQSNYAKGWKGLKAITPMETEAFKAWVSDGVKTKPVAASGAQAIKQPARDQGGELPAGPGSTRATPAPAAPTETTDAKRPEALIALRKRESVLKSLKECLG